MHVYNFITLRIYTILLLFEAIVFGIFIGAVGLGQVSNIIVINHYIVAMAFHFVITYLCIYS